MDLYSLYFHIPFCQKRCYYCDFNTYAGMEAWIPRFTDALCSEIKQVSALSGERLPVHTLFFGGGTPSLLGESHFAQILEAVEQGFSLQPNLEASLEANPGTITLAYLQTLRRLGFNRLSLGMQSANPEELKLLGRIHDTTEVIKAVKWARQAGFDNLNLDLIFGLPGQTMEVWQNTVNLVLGLRPEHLSMYALTIEEGTLFYRWTQRGAISMPDDDAAAEMYEWAGDRLADEGYFQYEISNWARNDENGSIRACRHNLQYWRSLPYLGFGPGAHGFAGGVRTANVLAIPAYIKKCSQPAGSSFPVGPAAAETRAVDPLTEMQETMMVGLRLVDEGVSFTKFHERFGISLEQAFGKQINKLCSQGLLEVSVDRLRLTKHGRLLGNRVFVEFI
jgi:oxygen-independent coproporphyrinogen-3 oxidase